MAFATGANADAGHSAGSAKENPQNGKVQSGRSGAGMMEQMRELHRAHKHGHDFKAMEAMTPDQAERVFKLMRDVGLVLPPMDSKRGRDLFVKKGCVLCHSINGVGGDVGPSLDAKDMPATMNAFDFAARMWKGAPAMAAMQEEELGAFIGLSGQDLADLIAFAHDNREQRKLSLSQVPEKFRKKLAE